MREKVRGRRRQEVEMVWRETGKEKMKMKTRMEKGRRVKKILRSMKTYVRPSNSSEVTENLDAFSFRPVVPVCEVSSHIEDGGCGRESERCKDERLWKNERRRWRGDEIETGVGSEWWTVVKWEKVAIEGGGEQGKGAQNAECSTQYAPKEGSRVWMDGRNSGAKDALWRRQCGCGKGGGEESGGWSDEWRTTNSVWKAEAELGEEEYDWVKGWTDERPPNDRMNEWWEQRTTVWWSIDQTMKVSSEWRRVEVE
jgi:hypothetical protein